MQGQITRKPAPRLLNVVLLVLVSVIPGLCRDHARQAMPNSCELSGFEKNATYVGSEVCQGCHDDKYQKIAITQHWQEMLTSSAARPEPGCESCHGPGSAHVEAGGGKQKIFSFAPGSAAFCNPCQSCHDAANISKSPPTTRRGWRGIRAMP